MSNIFLIIAAIGIFYIFCNLFQTVKKTQNKNALNKIFQNHLNKIFILFCLLIFTAEFYHLFNFIANDFSYNVVFENSSIHQNLSDKIAASYSGSGGSFLLWLFFLAIISLIFHRQINKNHEAKSQKEILQVVSTLFCVVLAIALHFNNPFEKTLAVHTVLPEIPIDGFGLKTVLRSSFNLFHPPLLFIGFSLLYIPYVLAVSSLICKKYFNDFLKLTPRHCEDLSEAIHKNKIDCHAIALNDDYSFNFDWLKLALQYNKFGLFFLSAGILLGSFWAYFSLGWGGFWGWDPIENAALIPMILSICLLHSSLIYRKNKGLLKTCLCLSLLIFPTILLCTFLARSGVILEISMHSYAGIQSEVHKIILGFLLLVLFVSLTVYFFRLRNIFSEYRPVSLAKSFSPSFAISLGIIILFCISFVIFIGTCLPIFAQFFGINTVPITPNFYTFWTLPLSMLILLLIGVSEFLKENNTVEKPKEIPHQVRNDSNGETRHTALDAVSPQDKSDFTKFSNAILPSFFLSTVLMIFIFFKGVNRIEFLLLSFCCLFAIFSQLQNFIFSTVKNIKNVKNKNLFFRNFGKFLSHSGISIFIFSAMLFGNFEQEFTVDLPQNETVEMSAYKIIFRGIETVNTTDFIKHSANIEVFDLQNNSVKLSPSFIISNKKMNVNLERFPSVSRIGINDIYIEPLNYFSDDFLTVDENFPSVLRINFAIKPFIIFVWLGGILLVFGFFISLFWREI